MIGKCLRRQRTIAIQVVAYPIGHYRNSGGCTPSLYTDSSAIVVRTGQRLREWLAALFWAASSRAASVRGFSFYAPQHRLNLLPLAHGHGALRAQFGNPFAAGRAAPASFAAMSAITPGADVVRVRFRRASSTDRSEQFHLSVSIRHDRMRIRGISRNSP